MGQSYVELITYDALYNLMLNGSDNMFIHGAAGYGKSHLIKKLHNETTRVLFTAPSGIAALNINGVTLHSLFCLKPVTPQPLNNYSRLTINSKQLLRNAETLLIDEISMVSADLLDTIDIILKDVRKSNNPFGGLRVIFVGDIFQLQPFFPNKNEKEKKKVKTLMRKLYPGYTKFGFYASNVFHNLDFIKNIKVYILNHDYRHENDPEFENILSNIRMNIITNEELERLNSRVIDEKTNCVYLTTTHSIADYNNKIELDALSDKVDTSIIKKNIFESGEYFDNDMYPMIDELKIKKGMKIIFVMNDSRAKGKRWVNGTFGTITKKYYMNDDLVSVEISIERGLGIERTEVVSKEWYDVYIPTFNESKNKIGSLKIASVYQFPFIAAWAITIHKSQSLTLQSAKLELGPKVFADGQLYTALSRVQNINDLYLNSPLRKSDIRISNDTINFYESFIIPKMSLVDLVDYMETNPSYEDWDEYRNNAEYFIPNSVANDFRNGLDYDELKNQFYEDTMKQVRITKSIKRTNIKRPNAFMNNASKHNYIISNNNEEDKIFDRRILLEGKTTERIHKIEEGKVVLSRIPLEKKAPEGIDKIKVILNPYFIDFEKEKEMESSNIKGKVFLDSHNRLTYHKGGTSRMLAIHAEYLNHKKDFYLSFAQAIYTLIEKGLYKIDFMQSLDKVKAMYFIYKNIKHFILLVSEAEFYFNINRDAISIKEIAVAYKHLIKITDKKGKGISYYTSDANKDYSRRSTGIIYDRDKKLLKNNQIKHEDIEKDPYKVRLEFRIFNIIWDWLSIENFKGTYDEIINRHLSFLSIIYKKLLKDHIVINTCENIYLDKIVNLSNAVNKTYYTNDNNELIKQEPRRKEYNSINNIDITIKEKKYEELKNDYVAFLNNDNIEHEIILFHKMLESIN